MMIFDSACTAKKLNQTHKPAESVKAKKGSILFMEQENKVK